VPAFLGERQTKLNLKPLYRVNSKFGSIKKAIAKDLHFEVHEYYEELARRDISSRGGRIRSVRAQKEVLETDRSILQHRHAGQRSPVRYHKVRNVLLQSKFSLKKKVAKQVGLFAAYKNRRAKTNQGKFPASYKSYALASAAHDDTRRRITKAIRGANPQPSRAHRVQSGRKLQLLRTLQGVRYVSFVRARRMKPLAITHTPVGTTFNNDLYSV